jgi:hypothetical protein
MKRIIGYFFVFCLLTSFTCLAQETLTITTYYPAPFGIYQRMATNTLGVGDNDGSGVVDAADSPNSAVIGQSGDIWISGDVGIGTTSPTGKLHIRENAATDNVNRPRFIMEDSPVAAGGSGYIYDIRLRKNSAGRMFINSYFPLKATEPSWGMFMQVDEDQNTRFFGNLTVSAGTGRPTPILLDLNGDADISGTLKVGPYTFPTGVGRRGQCLKTDGTGATAWQPCVCPPPTKTYSGSGVIQAVVGDGAVCHWSSRWGCQAGVINNASSRSRVCQYNGYSTVRSYTSRTWSSPGDNWIDTYNSPGNWTDRRGQRSRWVDRIVCADPPPCW